MCQAEYFHPVEDVINLIPFLAGVLLQGSHLCTIVIWTVLRISEIVDAHSGYELPFSPWEQLRKAIMQTFDTAYSLRVDRIACTLGRVLVHSVACLSLTTAVQVQGGALRHEYHHSHNVGCYGSFTNVLWSKYHHVHIVVLVCAHQ